MLCFYGLVLTVKDFNNSSQMDRVTLFRLLLLLLGLAVFAILDGRILNKSIMRSAGKEENSAQRNVTP